MYNYFYIMYINGYLKMLEQAFYDTGTNFDIHQTKFYKLHTYLIYTLNTMRSQFYLLFKCFNKKTIIHLQFSINN